MAIRLFIRFTAWHLAVLVLTGFNLKSGVVLADECSVLEFLEKKSSAAQVLVNPCLNEKRIGVGSVVQLSPQGRLWLQSTTMETPPNYQLICRNKSVKTLSISVTSTLFPWIKLNGFSQCSGWVDNKLICQNFESGSELFFCVAALIKKPKIRQEIQRKTSVTMRGLAENGQFDALSEVASQVLDQLADVIKSEIDLCRKVYWSLQRVTVEWTIYNSGLASKPVIKEPGVDSEFAECISEVITDFDYPAFPKDVRVVYQF
ncbi:MAG: hypothetical protein ACU85E_03615 [Gammaproteobacteria bacterium]